MSFKLIARYLFFALLYLLITQESITKAILVFVITSTSIFLAKNFNSQNDGRFLALISSLLILPLALPIELRQEYLPAGYQYISISLIASIIYITLNREKSKNLNTLETILLASTATLAPTTYLAGPSATIVDLKQSTNYINKLPRINSTSVQLCASGFFRISVGYLLTSAELNPVIINNYILNNHNLLFIIGYGFYSFWKYYLLFSGASDMCKGLLSTIGINVIDNFNNPELSLFYHDIWGRWHLNITDRVRNYLFTPITLFCLRKFSKFNSLFKFILIETLPIVALFTILAIWHGGRPKDFLFGFISTILTITSRYLGKQFWLRSFLSKSKTFSELFRISSIILFGLTLYIYDFNNYTQPININLDISIFYFLPSLIISIIIYIYLRYKITTLKAQKREGKILKNIPIYLIILELITAIIIQLYFLPQAIIENDFIYFAN